MANEYMSNEFESLESDAAKRIISLYPPKSVYSAIGRIERLSGEKGLAIALTIADLDFKVSEVRRREGFDSAEFRIQLIGQLGLAAEDFRLKELDLTLGLAAMSDLDA